MDPRFLAQGCIWYSCYREFLYISYKENSYISYKTVIWFDWWQNRTKVFSEQFQESTTPGIDKIIFLFHNFKINVNSILSTYYFFVLKLFLHISLFIYISNKNYWFDKYIIIILVIYIYRKKMLNNHLKKLKLVIVKNIYIIHLRHL